VYTVTGSILFYDLPFLYTAYMELKEEGEQGLWPGMNWNNRDDYVETYFRQWMQYPGSQRYTKEQNKSPLRKAVDHVFRTPAAYIPILVIIIGVFLAFYWQLFQSMGNLAFAVVLISSASALFNAVYKIATRKKRKKQQ
jgi:hypothetical protein